LYEKTQVVFDPALLGSWADDKGERRLILTSGDGQKYDLVFLDTNSGGHRFQAHLVQLEGVSFLDVSSQDPKKADPYIADLYIPVHTFYRVVHIEPRLQLLRLDGNWLNTYLDANPDAIRHERTDHGILLMAPTRELQAFIIERSFTEGAWDSLIMTRIEIEPEAR
jgi:hypothetical protein